MLKKIKNKEEGSMVYDSDSLPIPVDIMSSTSCLT